MISVIITEFFKAPPAVEAYHSSVFIPGLEMMLPRFNPRQAEPLGEVVFNHISRGRRKPINYSLDYDQCLMCSFLPSPREEVFGALFGPSRLWPYIGCYRPRPGKEDLG